MVSARRREPAPGVFRLVLPLPFEGLRNVNAYVIAGDEPVLVDCGIRDPEAADHGWGALVSALRTCDLGVEDIARLVVTHPHADHYGMAARVVEVSGCELWMHETAGEELDAYRDPGARAERVRATLRAHGVSGQELEEITRFEDWRSYLSGVVEASAWARDAMTLVAGGREWEIVHTPGHSRSHVCLWSEADAVLVSGDHLLPSVTPHIDLGPGVADPLADYISSLERIEKLAPQLVLPGHGRPFEGGAERARATLRHHDRRLGAIVQVVRDAPKTASEVSDAIFGDALLNFERRLAVGEALAHLAYLERRGELEREHGDDALVRYRKVARAPQS